MIKSIDHILVAVEDLDKAVEDYSLVFGFGPTWQGSHPSLGTKNALFPLDNLYFELIAVNHNGPLGAHYDLQQSIQNKDCPEEIGRFSFPEMDDFLAK